MTALSRITSVHNPWVKRLKALHLRKCREETGLFLLEGVKLVEEALAAGRDPVEVAVAERLEEEESGRHLLQALEARCVSVRRVADHVLKTLADTETNQGVVAVFETRPRALDDLLHSTSGDRLVVAAGIQDPGNLGALVRVAEAFGASGLIAASATCPWSPRAARASAGSVLRLPIAVAGDVSPLLQTLHQRGYRTVAAVALGGEPPGAEILRPPLALVLGSEGAGLDPSALALVRERITIPLAATVESLNVATAAAVLLYAARISE